MAAKQQQLDEDFALPASAIRGSGPVLSLSAKAAGKRPSRLAQTHLDAERSPSPRKPPAPLHRVDTGGTVHSFPRRSSSPSVVHPVPRPAGEPFPCLSQAAPTNPPTRGRTGSREGVSRVRKEGRLARFFRRRSAWLALAAGLALALYFIPIIGPVLGPLTGLIGPFLGVFVDGG